MNFCRHAPKCWLSVGDQNKLLPARIKDQGFIKDRWPIDGPIIDQQMFKMNFCRQGQGRNGGALH